MKKTLYTLLGLSFLDILSFSFILPVLPFIIKGYGGGAIEVSYAVSSSAVGMFIGGMFFGKLSDIFGRKKILLLTIIFNIIGYLLFAISKNLEFFIFSRFICGLGGGGISVVQAFIGNISNDKNRMANMGKIGASIGLGFTIGPIFGSFLESFGMQNMGFYSAFMLFTSLITSIFLLPEKHDKYSDEISIKKAPANLLIIFISFFVVTASFAGIQTIFALYLNDIFGFTAKNVAYTFGFMGIIAIIYQGFILQKIGDRIKEKTLVIFGLISLGLAFLIFPKVHNLFIIYILLIFFSIGLSSANSSIYSLIGKHSHKNDYGENMGINTAFGSIADIVGPLASGFLYVESFKMPFYFFGLMLLFNIVAVYFLIEK